MRQRSRENMIGPRKLTVAEDIAEEIKALVSSEKYGPGARLPSERDLALQLGVSRPSIRQALSALVRMGILETRRGSGTQVARSSENILTAPFEMLVLMENPTVYDLYEVRELLEVHLAGRAAERRTADELETIAQAMRAMNGQSTIHDYDIERDMAFHRAIAAAAHNPVAERILVCLQDGIQAGMERALPSVRDWRDSYDIHRRIYQAIRDASAADARRAMRIHMAMAVEEFRRQEPGEDDHGAST